MRRFGTPPHAFLSVARLCLRCRLTSGRKIIDPLGAPSETPTVPSLRLHGVSGSSVSVVTVLPEGQLKTGFKSQQGHRRCSGAAQTRHLTQCMALSSVELLYVANRVTRCSSVQKRKFQFWGLHSRVLRTPSSAAQRCLTSHKMGIMKARNFLRVE